MKTVLSTLYVLTLTIVATGACAITPVQYLGKNPGGIEMYRYVPRNMPSQAPLVVSLHGCLQDAGSYSHAGWIPLADRWKFYILFPQQTIQNNLYRCWNWFKTGDTRREPGGNSFNRGNGKQDEE